MIFMSVFIFCCYAEKRQMDTDQRMKNRIKTVLIIEDEVDIRNFIVRVLELEGYTVLEAGNSSGGMEIIQKNAVDLVLLDLRLPGPDGWSLLREVRRDPEFSNIPVVVLTAIAETIQRRKTLRMGADCYLVKPVSAHSLSRTVAAVFSGRSSCPASPENIDRAKTTEKAKLRPLRYPLP
jgi:DNA-binding response OmpR family regulator